MKKENYKNLSYIICLILLPSILFVFEYVLNYITQHLMLLKFQSSFYMLALLLMPLMRGIIIGVIFLFVLYLNRKLMKLTKFGLIVTVLCLAIYPTLYLLSWLMFTTFPLIYKILGNLLYSSVHYVVVMIILIILENLMVKRSNVER